MLSKIKSITVLMNCFVQCDLHYNMNIEYFYTLNVYILELDKIITSFLFNHNVHVTVDMYQNCA